MNAAYFDDEETNKINEEIEFSLEKIDRLSQYIETGFELDFILQETIQILHNFNVNIVSIGDVINKLPNKDNSKHRFLIGILFGGVVSAYEGMVHDFVDLLMNSINFKKEEAIKKIPQEVLNALKIKEGLAWNELAKFLQKATLNRPNIVARILNALFEFNIPEGNEKEIASLIKMRNDFAHNNGFSRDGLVHNPSWDELNAFCTLMDELVSSYAISLQAKADEFPKKPPI